MFSLKILVKLFDCKLISTEILYFIVQMQAVYVPEDDRCTDILGLVEDEDNLKYSFSSRILFFD